MALGGGPVLQEQRQVTSVKAGSTRRLRAGVGVASYRTIRWGRFKAKVLFGGLGEAAAARLIWILGPRIWGGSVPAKELRTLAGEIHLFV